jgi:single stranded DNA-binding protein
MANDACVFVTGNLIKDPTHSVVNNQTVVSFTIAVNTTLKKADGTGYESNFYNVSLWGKPGEWLLEKAQKGTQVEVVGELFLQKYTNKNTGESGQSINIRAYKVTPRARMKGAPTRQANTNQESNEEPDELPFK